MDIKATKPLRIVILGAGFGGVYAFKKLRQIFKNDPRIKLTLVNNKNYFLFTPLLHEVATGGVSRENVVEPLRKVLGCSLSEFRLANVLSIDLGQKRVVLDNGHCDYDFLILALGADTNFYNTPGAQENSFTLKNLEDAVRLKNHFIQKLEYASSMRAEELPEALTHFVVVGGGATGVELSAEMSELFFQTFGKYYRHHEFFSKVKITLLQKQNELLHRFSKKIRDKALEVLRDKKVDVKLGVEVNEVGKDYIKLRSGEFIPTETTIWVAGIKPNQVNISGEIKYSPQGKIVVNKFLQVENHPEVFALGDMASFGDANTAELPALAQVATKAAEAVAINLGELIHGRPLREFTYEHSGDLISIGQWMAAAEIKKFYFANRFAWWLWRTVYLFKLISFPKKIKVATDWTINLFMPRDISEL